MAEKRQVLDEAQVRTNAAKASGAFTLAIGSYVLAAFMAYAAKTEKGWDSKVNAFASLGCVILGFALQMSSTRWARGTRLEPGARALLGPVALVALLVWGIAAIGDATSFFSAMAGIGAGIITQAAFHYGFVDSVSEPKRPGHRERLQSILARARR